MLEQDSLNHFTLILYALLYTYKLILLGRLRAFYDHPLFTIKVHRVSVTLVKINIKVLEHRLVRIWA